MKKVNAPLVSVIITTYNRAGLLRQAIESVLEQTYDCIEIIVVDDGSTDNTEKVVESFKSTKIQYIWTTNWGGPARPRNIGIRRARGEFIAFLDADDYWKAEKLEVQLPHFNNSNLIGVGTNIIKIGELKFERQALARKDLELNFRGLLFRRTAALSSLVVRNVGFTFEEREDFKFVEDFDFQLALTCRTGNKIRILREPLVFYRMHKSNASKQLNNAENTFYVLDKYKRMISNEEMSKLVARAHLNLGKKAIRIHSLNASPYFEKAMHCTDKHTYLLAHTGVIYSKFPSNLRVGLLSLYFYLFRSLTRARSAIQRRKN
ncbi:MAG: glycosyltransferase [Desulfobacterales bacterium]|nr:glycosyltransferase [Desulfobacterales bacterium]